MPYIEPIDDPYPSWRLDSVAWSRWSVRGYRVTTSRAHLEAHEDGGCDTPRTLCGVIIPDEGNGIEYEERDAGRCRTCERLARLALAKDD